MANAGKTTDAMLDKVSELIAERNEALARLERIRTLVDGTEWTDLSWRSARDAVSLALPVPKSSGSRSES